MIGTIKKISELEYTEYEQDGGKVDDIKKAMGDDLDLVDWDDVPAIVINEKNEILDGHHRVAAVCKTLGVWRALVVDSDRWEDLMAGGHTNAVRAVADEYDDAVTWGAA